MSETLAGRCHCGAVEFEIDVPGGIEVFRRCNCSICRRRGVVVTGVPVERLRVTRGEEALKLYQWNTRVAMHYFCRRCGVYTHHRRRSDPSEYAVNLACLEPPVEVPADRITLLDGASNAIFETP